MNPTEPTNALAEEINKGAGNDNATAPQLTESQIKTLCDARLNQRLFAGNKEYKTPLGWKVSDVENMRIFDPEKHKRETDRERALMEAESQQALVDYALAGKARAGSMLREIDTLMETVRQSKLEAENRQAEKIAAAVAKVMPTPAQIGAGEQGEGRKPKPKMEVTRPAAAKMLGVSLSTVKNWDKGPCPYLNYPGRYSATELFKWWQTTKGIQDTARMLKNKGRGKALDNKADRAKEEDDKYNGRRQGNDW